MKDIRYKEIMLNLGYPNSQSLLVALQQVANEVAQEIRASNKKIILKEELVKELLNIIADLTDNSNCAFDHHGDCQEHGWFSVKECPHSRAKRMLTKFNE